jgi:hypothetical protein
MIANSKKTKSINTFKSASDIMFSESASPITASIDSKSRTIDINFSTKKDFFVSHDDKEKTLISLQSLGKVGTYNDAKLDASPTVVETFSVSDVAVHSIPPTDSYFYTSTFGTISNDSLESIDRYIPNDRTDDDTEREDECPNQDSLHFSQTRIEFAAMPVAMERKIRIMQSSSSDSGSYGAAREKSLFDEDDDEESVDFYQNRLAADSLPDPQVMPICVTSHPSFHYDTIENKTECNMKNVSFQPVLDYSSSLRVSSTLKSRFRLFFTDSHTCGFRTYTIVFLIIQG